MGLFEFLHSKDKNKEILEKLEEINQKLEQLNKLEKLDQIDDIPKDVLNALEIKNSYVARSILGLIQNNDGKMSSCELLRNVKQENICAKNTLYKYLKKMVAQGYLTRVKEGKNTYYQFAKFRND